MKLILGLGNPICGDIMRMYIKVKDNRLDLFYN